MIFSSFLRAGLPSCISSETCVKCNGATEYRSFFHVINLLPTGSTLDQPRMPYLRMKFRKRSKNVGPEIEQMKLALLLPEKRPE